MQASRRYDVSPAPVMRTARKRPLQAPKRKHVGRIARLQQPTPGAVRRGALAAYFCAGLSSSAKREAP
jgi:hypothetical protein